MALITFQRYSFPKMFLVFLKLEFNKIGKYGVKMRLNLRIVIIFVSSSL